MEPFISKIIDILLADNSVPMHEVAVILPNRRAGRILLKGLYEKNGGKPLFAPQIFPMEEFVSYLSPLKVIDQVSQLLRLHSLTRQFQGERFAMHQLLTWGTVFLKDISDMDMQLQDVPATLKEYAKAAQFEISFGKEGVESADFDRIQFNALLADFYTQYKALLESHFEAYEGMIYRDCAENISKYAEKVPFRRLVFAGFYALSPSELEIVRYFKEHSATEIYFDTDPFYCHLEGTEGVGKSLPQHETSFFIRRNCQKLGLDIGKFDFCEPDFATISKEVKIISTAKNMRQIYCAIREVDRIKEQKINEIGGTENLSDGIVDMSDTAVVLADEELLLPFLLSYQPKNVIVNATMGFPFEATPVFALLQQVLAIYESAFALTPDDASELSFSGDLVAQIWDHPLMKADKPQNVFFPAVLRYSQLPHNELFENVPKKNLSRRMPEVLLKFCQYAAQKEQGELYQQLWQEANRVLTELQTRFDQYFAETEIVDFPFAQFSILKTLHNVSISLTGDPDKGLQVMGLLETRMMDFRHVIMLSVNEGILPKGITYDSLLPFDFKFKFDGKDALPNYLYQDQVYAYHFFRLLQRASDITLIYNSASDANLAEKSRFIAQLAYEVKDQKLEDVVRLQYCDEDFNLQLPERVPLEISKTSSIMELLRAYTFSASSLQTYVSCPLKFYLRHLMKIQEVTKLTDQLAPNELGTVIHELYKLAFDEIINEANSSNYPEILQRHIDSCDEDVRRLIRTLDNRQTLSDSDLEQGHWIINRRIIQETVCHYLEMAKKELLEMPWKISSNEYKVNISDFPVQPSVGEPFMVRMTGSLDRVQKNGDKVMVLDYKTGKVEKSSLRVTVKKADEGVPEVMSEAVNKIFTDSKYDKLFQLVVYALMYDHVTKGADYVSAGIISTREINKNNLDYILRASIFDEENLLVYEDLLSDHLNRLFCEIFDESVPFTQTEDENKCKICEFLHLCGRQTTAESRA